MKTRSCSKASSGQCLAQSGRSCRHGSDGLTEWHFNIAGPSANRFSFDTPWMN